MTITRRELLKAAAAAPCLAALPGRGRCRPVEERWVRGHMSGAQALVEALIDEGAECVFGIPGAQENELWDTFKTKNLCYQLTTHEFAAAGMADGYARATGRPGVLCVVPGPGLTNSLTGIGEALLDSIPMVVIVGDISNGPNARPFQVHALENACLLRPVCKEVFPVQNVTEIPHRVRQAFQLAQAGEPGPVGVVVPWNLFLEAARFQSGPLAPLGVPWNDQEASRAMNLLMDRRLRVGIYAGQGCMNYAADVTRLAELLQAPVATSMSGKGVIDENHPLSVGWGYGPQGTVAAEAAFSRVDVVLAMGVKFSEVSTGFYSLPQHRNLIHVDINPASIGRVMRTNYPVNADAQLFMSQVQAQADLFRREPDTRMLELIRQIRNDQAGSYAQIVSRSNVDPVAFLLALRKHMAPEAMAFVDVTLSQYWATELMTTSQPRTFFNPTNNQSMGWSIPAALGAQAAWPGRQTVTVTGDGCFLMSAMEITTAARSNLPVKFFVLDDQAYHYMQELQRPAYMRTTATMLAHMNYRSLANAFDVAYQDISQNDDLDGRILGVLQHDGPVLAQVRIDYGARPVRWLAAARERFTNELTRDQKIRFAARIAYRSLDRNPRND